MTCSWPRLTVLCRFKDAFLFGLFSSLNKTNHKQLVYVKEQKSISMEIEGNYFGNRCFKILCSQGMVQYHPGE